MLTKLSGEQKPAFPSPHKCAWSTLHIVEMHHRTPVKAQDSSGDGHSDSCNPLGLSWGLDLSQRD